MIVCSCNVLSDHEVRTALRSEEAPRTTCQVYRCFGCSAQCGRCARSIRRIMNEALAAAEQVADKVLEQACGNDCACDHCQAV